MKKITKNIKIKVVSLDWQMGDDYIEELGTESELYGTPANEQEYKEFKKAIVKHQFDDPYFLEEGNSEKWVSFFEKDKNCPFEWDYDPKSDGYLEFWWKE